MSEAPSSRRGGPGGGKAKKPELERYQLMHKSYEDPSYEGTGTAAVLQKLGEQRDPFAALMDDGKRFEMQMMNDLGDDDKELDHELFGEGTWECDFDQDFVKEMNERDEDDQEVYELGEFDFSAERGGKKTDEDKMLERALRDYDYDGDLGKNDPGTEGPEVNVNLYKPALQEFVDDTKKVDFLGTDEDMADMQMFDPSPNEINPAVPRGMGDAVYHANEEGVFLTVYSSQRSRNLAIDYRTGLRESNRAVKQRIMDDPDAALADEVDSDDLFEEEEEKEEFDIESKLSTLTNTENRPIVIGTREGLRYAILPKKRKPRKQVRAGDMEDAVEEELDADVADRLTALTATATSGRPKDETTDEKKERKKLVKEGRKLKREQKKGLKVAFRTEETKQRVTTQNTEMQKRTLPLGAR